jgi:glycosyltransferase involved in cell wall biosynthesis
VNKDNLVVAFFPHNPIPAKSGAHQRFLELISAFSDLGCKVVMLSSSIWSDNPWTEQAIIELKRITGSKPLIYQPNKEDLVFREESKKNNPNPPIDDFFRSPPGFKKWFRDKIIELNPSTIFMTYVFWDKVLDHSAIKDITKVIDTHEIATLQMPWEARLREYKYFYSRPESLDEITSDSISDDFFLDEEVKPQQLEFNTYEKYDYTIAISKSEEEIIKLNTKKTNVIYLPMTYAPVDIPNKYTANAVLPIGPNPLNLQGYYYFVKNILPIVLKRCPDFELEITGPWCDKILDVPGIKLRGFIPNLADLYLEAAFLPCPIFGGTGQQVKIVEALAHGLPVIAFEAAAKTSPIIHNVNGLIAHDALEFAEHTVYLWQNRDFCQELGRAGRETIRNEFSSNLSQRVVKSFIGQRIETSF